MHSARSTPHTPHEIELKFQVPPSARARLQAALAQAEVGVRQVHLQARYFDTADRLLGRHAFALRLRQEGEGWVQTLKGRGDGMMTRLEHNAPLGAVPVGSVPELLLERHGQTAAGAALLALLAQHGRQMSDLRLQFATDIQRTQAQVHGEGVVLELALDIGAIRGGEASAELPVWELELELLEGSPRGLLAQAQLWVEAFELWLDVRTKAERGDRVARGVSTGEVPALTPPDAREPWPRQVGAALRPVLALASDVADGLATPAQQVVLAQALMGLMAVLHQRPALTADVLPTLSWLAGAVFDAAVWRQPATQALWLTVLDWSFGADD